MSRTASIALLGPQRHLPMVRPALDALPDVDAHAPIAFVAAGWEEREREHEEFEQHVGGQVINLEVYRQLEEIYARDPSLREAVRERHDRLRDLQALYRTRLSHGLAAARELLATDGDPSLLEPERDAAVEAVRTIDAHHVARVEAIHDEFRAEYGFDEHELIGRYRERLRLQLDACGVLCLAGGHVAILLNRLRAAGVVEEWGDRPIVAWGAGAMVISERVVLFHDHPPQGAGNAEVLEIGLGVAADVVPLPHASVRLRLTDAARVRLFARRFGPSLCVALDPESGVALAADDVSWRALPRVCRLSDDGTVVELGAEAAARP